MAYKFLPNLPPVSEEPTDLLKVSGPVLGNDLEWSQTEQPTVFGVSDGTTTVSVPFGDGVEWFRQQINEHTWVGHNILAADKLVLDRMGIVIPIEKIEDTILWHWLVNMHLCKAGKAGLEEEGDERRGRGFMNLWTMLSIYTDFWHYKDCRDKKLSKKNPDPPRVFCFGPCPRHEKYQYNGLDALGPVLSLPKLKQQAKLRGVDKLYPLHRELMWVLAQMREFGLRINVPYVYPKSIHPLGSTDGNSLEEQFQRERKEIESQLPFNPRSPKVVVEYFKELGLENAQEATIRETVEDLGEQTPKELQLLLDYKELGNGVGRWFEPEYRDEDGWLKGYLDESGYVHPRLNPFTSTGRLACSSPNFQNVYVRKGEQIRRAIITPEGWYIVRADYSNAENRVVLHFSDYKIARDLDLHTWVAELAGLTPEMDFVKRIGGGKPRQAAKSIQHASNILEGLQLKTPDALRTKKIRSEINAGARLVYPNWLFRGKVVTFTGVNLSRRVYGDASYEHRAQALGIQKTYFDRFPNIRKFQQRVSKQCEVEGAVRTPLGYVLLSFGDDEERMKIAQGCWQQQPVAHLTKLALINLWKRWERDRKMRPVLQVHDEIVCYVRNEVDPGIAKKWLQLDMEIGVSEIPGLVIPAEPTYARTWAKSDQKT